MATKKLNQSIFRLVVGLVMLTATMILINVWSSTSKHAEHQLNNDLKVAQNVFEQVLANRENVLYNSASVLTADFGFKQAVATGDRPTINSALFNHRGRINADLMALVSLNGKNISSVPKILVPDQTFPYPRVVQNAISNGGASSLLFIDQRLYQVMMLTIDAPTPIAVAVIGFEINQEWGQQLKNITQLETTIEVQTKGEETFTISTLPANLVAPTLAQQDQPLSWLSLSLLNDVPYVSRRFLLADEDNFKVLITLSNDVHRLFADFRALQTNIALIALLAIILALCFAALFSRKVAKPLVALADIAQRISSGDYNKAINTTSSSTEVTNLAIALESMQSNIRQREEKISYQAQHDILTGLNNRYNMEVQLNAKFEQNKPFQVLGINVFGFRGINDVFGYHNGDICLQILAKRLAEYGGLGARLAGGELLWIPDTLVTHEQVIAFKNTLEEPIETGDASITTRVSVGMLNCPIDAQNAEELFRRMNIVLDETQKTEQLMLSYEPEYEHRYLRRLSIIAELKTALNDQQEELSLFYQPKLDLISGTVTKVEALIRWNNALLGFVSPEDFISVAEQAGFIGKITDWVINQAIKDAVILKGLGLNVSIAINLSAKDVMDDTLLPHIITLMNASQLETNALSFEMTESDLVQEPEKAIQQLQAFRNRGFEMAIDDFGTGYSSMSYLKNLPVTTLKVDKSFVLKLDSQQGDQKIVRSVIDLAHNFGLNVVAEGIENQATLKLLHGWGCELAQGFYMSKPLPLNDFVQWHKKHQSTNWLED
ncbi:EAL domain-containing protein [Paraglaciecola sp. L1A13]|uniref:bifunctional diguanylate cyclase/phosphodiesterase n=1 Tax=Paraglaciecola sp. L1A13 TaxID=2686359 RepID=UPI00131C139C|nr:EAL domain-containing protein [Paraglaciecola sp. L1A13]